jgi:hypothetical protein
VFPPSPGIGGRRWVKFAKYFVRMSYDVKIITAKRNKKSTISNWIKDMTKLEGLVDYIPSKYPYYLGVSPSSFIQKIAYRLSLTYAKLVLKGNYYDKGGFWGEKLKKKVEYYISKGYNNVIVSVAPFHNAIHLIPLISKYRDVNFIVDFRDPWINNKTAYGYESLPKQRKDYEIQNQKKVLNNYSYVVSVAETMTNYFRSKSSFPNCLTIANGYDKEDFKTSQLLSENDGFINLLFSGSFYSGAEYLLNDLNSALLKLKDENSNLYNKLKIKFIGNIPFSTDYYVKSNPSVFKFYGKIKLQETITEINNSDGCLLFLTDDINYSLSTKFCEYLFCQKPILVFSQPGKTCDFINENNLGVSVAPSEIFDKLSDLENILFNKKKVINTDLINQFDIANLAKKFDSILI